MSTENPSKLKLFSLLWESWRFDAEKNAFRAYCSKYQEHRYFIEDDLDAIDTRLWSALIYLKHKDPLQHIRQLPLLWGNRKRVIGFPNGLYCWENLVSITSTTDGKAEIMFDAYGPMVTISRINIASSDIRVPYSEKTWGEWEKLLPGVKAAYEITSLLKLDEYETATYCQEFMEGKKCDEHSLLALPGSLSDFDN